MDTKERVEQGALAAAALLGIGIETRNLALDLIARRLRESRAQIAEANAADIKAAREARLPSPLLKRLAFDDAKFAEALAGIQALRALPDPCGKILEARCLDDGLVLRRVSCPIGLIAMIFESRPDALVQMACLAAKSGNAIVLKGGSEARESNRILSSIIAQAGEEAGLPCGWLTALETREEIGSLLALDTLVDLVVPRGSREFVNRIKETSRIPVLGHSDGVCHVYVHEDADPAMAERVAVDSKIQYPAACNAAEVLIVHSAWARKGLAPLLSALSRAGVELEVCPRCADILGGTGIPFSVKTDGNWSVEYLDMKMAVRLVDSVNEAVQHINRFGSGHTDAIVSASRETAALFLTGVDSSSVYHNASTRFADGYRYGLGAEVGISTGKLHARGPMGLDGLLTYKWLLEGSGQTVADYASGARRFVHKDLPLDTGRQYGNE